ncbi:replication-associated protein [Sewage-associated circular DNA virus-12]|uniref:replication-associated protein n=1 Tax=Sewage-associated circular DNA virus-12 TaxID=1519388 RepID=UPI0004D189D1|nr:replication-associated protein [Sewage-associated circular DNA virus-12]AIF34802.1 replication-associated protein [Sewage-associated circular DNA virus-12]
MALKARYWCFTLNNWCDGELLEIAKFSGRYLTYGFEIGESGTPHLQGYCEYENPVTMGRVKKDISDRCHVEVRKGTQLQAVSYCHKDGNWLEYGEKAAGQGHRSDLDDVARDVLDKKSLMEIANDHPTSWIRYSRGIQSLANSQPPPRWRDVLVLVYWGVTGTGKTRRAMLEPSAYKLNQNTNGTLWFDGYDGQSTLVIDDFYGWIKYGELLTLLDGYPYRCQVKGGMAWARWDTVIITSNKCPDDWYPLVPDTAALKRRISAIRYFEPILDQK